MTCSWHQKIWVSFEESMSTWTSFGIITGCCIMLVGQDCCANSCRELNEQRNIVDSIIQSWQPSGCIIIVIMQYDFLLDKHDVWDEAKVSHYEVMFDEAPFDTCPVMSCCTVPGKKQKETFAGSTSFCSAGGAWGSLGFSLQHRAWFLWTTAIHSRWNQRDSFVTTSPTRVSFIRLLLHNPRHHLQPDGSVDRLLPAKALESTDVYCIYIYI